MLLDFNYENRQKMIKEFEAKSKTLIENKKHMLYFGWPKKEEKKEEKNDPRI